MSVFFFPVTEVAVSGLVVQARLRGLIMVFVWSLLGFGSLYRGVLYIGVGGLF